MILPRKRCVELTLCLLVCVLDKRERGDAGDRGADPISPYDVRRIPLYSDSSVRDSSLGVLKSSAMRGRRWMLRIITSG